MPSATDHRRYLGRPDEPFQVFLVRAVSALGLERVFEPWGPESQKVKRGRANHGLLKMSKHSLDPPEGSRVLKGWLDVERTHTEPTHNQPGA